MTTPVGRLRHGLRQLLADRTWRPFDTTADDAEVDALLRAVARHRVAPFLDRHAAAIEAPVRLRDELASRADAARLSSLVQMRRAVEVHDVLEAAGVPSLALKGPCLAVQAYGDAASRDPGDLDVLVARADVPRSVAALEAAGWTPDPTFLRPGPGAAWRYLGWSYYEIELRRGAETVDLHWDLGPVRTGLPDVPALRARGANVPIAGASLPTLAPEDALTHLCHHAAKDHWASLRSLLDVAALLRAGAAPAVRTPAVERTIALVDALLGVRPDDPRARPRTSPARTGADVALALRWQDDAVRAADWRGGVRLEAQARFRESRHPREVARFAAFKALGVADDGSGTLAGLLRHRLGHRVGDRGRASSAGG
ncbi:nucleotidyltransferase family protein [Nocardioides sp. TRM66260-LWL]|uniref:nucleotidyltransferase domain-containing protein n=1 Tax=Nocardioides sp. TRM66260-LWL TaxID=2874478 RepID=UPI001CC57706|nr:nucleotidyltransferase family protein [Nocardioides sp. TRM66260-LWL]MBZ5734968.1 nucleotidyltransferase family protein [Nocardioides sp. TRM66260-LWL]